MANQRPERPPEFGRRRPVRGKKEEEESSPFSMFILGGFFAVVLLVVGGFAGWFLTTQLSGGAVPANVVQEGQPPPPTATALIELGPTRTPRATFTPAPLPTLPPATPQSEAAPGAIEATLPTVRDRIPPGDDYVIFEVLAEDVLLHQGPDDSFPVVGRAVRDASVLVVGRTPDGIWWRVCCVRDQVVWLRLSGGNVRAVGDVGGVVIVEE